MTRWIVMAAVVAGLGAASVAHAEDPPWSKGVPKAAQDRANALYEAGNTLFGTKDYVGALAQYEAAIAIWNHPQIELNVAVALIRLNRPLEASDALEHALRFQAAPFKQAEDYQKALDYQALLRGQVGTIEVTCGEHVQLTLDGKPWLGCPGTQRLRVLAGEHTIVGEQPAFVPRSYRLAVTGGQTVTQHVALVPLESAVTLEYRYRRWLPWTVAGGGAALVAGGLGFYLHARAQLDKFDTNFAHDCAAGCNVDLSDHGPLKDQRDSALFQGNAVGIPMMVVGGSVVVGGLVMAILNRPHRVVPSMEVLPTAGGMQAAIGWQF